jgi:hypothetical protein
LFKSNGSSLIPADLHTRDLQTIARHGAAISKYQQKLAANIWLTQERIVDGVRSGPYYLMHAKQSDVKREDYALISSQALTKLANSVRLACKIDPEALGGVIVSLKACHTYTDLNNVIVDALQSLESTARRMKSERVAASRAAVLNVLGSLVTNERINEELMLA